MDFLFLNNIIYHIDGYDFDIEEILDFNINKIDKEKYNIVIHNKYNKTYTLCKIEFYKIENEKFEKDTDYSLYFIFDRNCMFDINKNIISYNYLFLNDNISYSYVNKFYNPKKTDQVLIIYYGSLKNYKNFSLFNVKFVFFMEQLFEKSNIKYMHCLNNDMYNNIAYSLSSDILALIDDVDENKFLYVSYMLYIFYKNISKLSFSKIIYTNINHSIIGLSNLLDVDLISNNSYHVDNFFKFCIFTENDFIKIANLYLNYSDKVDNNFFNYIKRSTNINFKKIENLSMLKIN